MQTQSSWAGSEYTKLAGLLLGTSDKVAFVRLDRLVKSAEELSKDTNRECMPVQADVRQPKTLQEAVTKTIEKFGRIDFVICGMYLIHAPKRFALTLVTGRSCW